MSDTNPDQIILNAQKATGFFDDIFNLLRCPPNEFDTSRRLSVAMFNEHWPNQKKSLEAYIKFFEGSRCICEEDFEYLDWVVQNGSTGFDEVINQVTNSNIFKHKIFHIRLMATRLRDIANLHSRSAIATADDGPDIPGTWIWKGVTFRGLRRKPWTLIKFVWSEQHRRSNGFSASVSEQMQEAMDEPNVTITYDDLTNWGKEIRKFFRKNSIPLNVHVNKRPDKVPQITIEKIPHA